MKSRSREQPAGRAGFLAPPFQKARTPAPHAGEGGIPERSLLVSVRGPT